jgi:hypothetical protein
VSRAPATASHWDRIQAAVSPTDTAARAAELRWGVARLEALVSAETLLRWRDGWSRYSTAIRQIDADQVERLAPKIAQAISVMEREAEARGHQPLAPAVWEAATADGRVLVVVRSQAEAHACVRASDGREMVVWSMDELATVLPQLEQLHAVKLSFPGSRVRSMVRRSEGFAHDWSTGDAEFHDVPEPVEATQ